jgi:hypothetical protein
MSKSRGRLLSPATAIAIVALFVALHGTGYAASRNAQTPTAMAAKAPADTTSDKKIAKQQATGVFKSSIGSAHVGFATTAGSASTATSSNHATNADNAARATNADNAAHATNADNATAAASANALGSVAYRFNTSAGAVTVPACSTNPCTPATVGTSYAIATCPQGTVAIGGGGETHDAGVELSGSFPTRQFGSSVPNAWQVDVDNFRQTASGVDYYVVCTAAKSVDNPSGV